MRLCAVDPVVLEIETVFVFVHLVAVVFYLFVHAFCVVFDRFDYRLAFLVSFVCLNPYFLVIVVRFCLSFVLAFLVQGIFVGVVTLLFFMLLFVVVSSLCISSNLWLKVLLIWSLAIVFRLLAGS
jgi:hypothetical protein